MPIPAAQLKHNGRIWNIHISADGQYLISSSADKTACVWTLQGEQQLCVQHDSDVTDALLTKDNSTLITASLDGSVRLWDFQNGTALEVFNYGTDVLDIDISPDNSLIAAGRKDGFVSIINIAIQPNVYNYNFSKGPVSIVQFRPDGRWLGVATKTGAIRIEVKPIFTATPSKDTPVHFGGRMAFLAGATLPIGLGDGFDYREKAQRLDSHLGKIVRIASDGSVPADNPFVGQTDVLPEIYSYGHRNVQGIAFDATTGRLYAHEHGRRGGDELNLIESGGNYGWPLATFGLDYSGAVISPFTERPGMVSPVRQWSPSIAPSGMVIYRGAMFPDWDGDFIVSAFAACCAQRLRLQDRTLVDGEVLFAELGARLRDVRVAPDGSLWLLTDDAKGKVLRVTAVDQ